MAYRVVHAPTETARRAATTQRAQLEAVSAAWGGGAVTARYFNASGDLLRTQTLPALSIDTLTTPYRFILGRYLADTHVAEDTAARIVLRAGSIDIAELDCGVTGSGASVELAGPIKESCPPDLEGVSISANPSVQPGRINSVQAVAAPQFWTKFSFPAVVVSGSKVFLGSTDMVGATVVSSYDLSNGSSVSVTLQAGGGEANGHNSAVVGVRPDGRLIVAWSEHNGNCYRRVSSAPGDITTLGSTVEISGATVVSYANLFRLSVCNRWFLHARSGPGGVGTNPCVAWSSADEGETWASAGTWLTQNGERPYVMHKTDGVSRVDFWCTNKHQTDVGIDTFFNLYHCYAIFNSSGVPTFYKTNGMLIGSTVARVSDDCTLVYEGASGGPAFPWDIEYGSDGHPRVVFARLNSSDDHRHMFGRWTGSAWVISEIGPSGPRLYSTEQWSNPGISFDPRNPNRVVRSLWVGAAAECQLWQTNDDGATWAKVRDITSGSAPGHHNVGAVRAINPSSAVSFGFMSGPIADWRDFDFALHLGGTD